MIVSCEQWRDSAIHIHVSIFPQTPLPSWLPHNVEQSSMYYTVGPCWLPILNISSVQFSSVAPLCPTLCDPMNCSMLGLPVHHQLPEFTQTQIYLFFNESNSLLTAYIMPQISEFLPEYPEPK